MMLAIHDNARRFVSSESEGDDSSNSNHRDNEEEIWMESKSIINETD